MDNKYLVTIITVCYNAGRSIIKTMESVLDQDFADFEYIIKDAASTDGSLKYIEEYRKKFEKKGIPFRFYSERDEGIYDGMNIAVKYAMGRWVCFMNAGDSFYSSRVLSNIFSEKQYPNAAIIYGDAIEYEYGHYYKFRKNFEAIEERMPFSHQSAFANRELLSRIPFNTDLKIGADYDFLLTVYKKGYHFQDTGEIVCIISKDGVSSLNSYDTFIESLEIRRAHDIKLPSGLALKRILLDKKLRQFVQNTFPKSVKKRIRQLQWRLRKQNFKVTLPHWEKAYHKVR
ncbi:MAG: glycosyltransferase [Lachnospiraceae bacterium]|nr:glycosyltransferase [Lachnospiraceae bacterium]